MNDFFKLSTQRKPKLLAYFVQDEIATRLPFVSWSSLVKPSKFLTQYIALRHLTKIIQICTDTAGFNVVLNVPASVGSI